MNTTSTQSLTVGLAPSVRLGVLFPTRDPRGRAFPPEYFATIEFFLVRAVGGFTRAGLAFGAWQTPDGSVVHDETVSYYVSCPTTDAPVLALKLQTLVTVLFEQEAAFGNSRMCGCSLSERKQ
jgi:hypothetical protein